MKNTPNEAKRSQRVFRDFVPRNFLFIKLFQIVTPAKTIGFVSQNIYPPPVLP